MGSLIDYNKFDFHYLEAGSTGLVSFDDFVWINSKWMVIAEIDIDPKITVKYRGFGDTLEGAESDCKKTIENYLYREYE